MISNVTLQNAYKGANGITRMMLGPSLVWPKAPTLIFDITNALLPFDISIDAPAQFLIFQEVGGAAYLFNAGRSTSNKTLSTEARGTERPYKMVHTQVDPKVSYNIPIQAKFVGSLSVQIVARSSRVSRPDRYTGYADRNNGSISAYIKNDYNINISFRFEVRNASGTIIANTIQDVSAGEHDSGSFYISDGRTIKTALPAGRYNIKVYNLTTGTIHETIVECQSVTRGWKVNRYTLLSGALDGLENLTATGSFSRRVIVYPSTRTKAYKAFYGDVAVVEVLAYNITGYDYKAFGNFLGNSVLQSQSNAEGACILLAKLMEGGSGYRANAFYPIFWEEPPSADVPFAATGEMVPFFVALTDSNGSVYDIVEYDERKYGYRLYNDRTSGAGMHWLHFHSTYYTVGSYYSVWLESWAPQYVTYLDPATGSHLTDSAWVAKNIRADAGQINDSTGTLIDPFSADGGADIVAIFGNISSQVYGYTSYVPWNPFSSAMAEYIDAPRTLHTLDPEEAWFSLPTHDISNSIVLDENGLPIIVSSQTVGYFDNQAWRYGNKAGRGSFLGTTQITIDPPTVGYPITSANWWYPNGGPRYDTSDFVNGIPPWRQSLGADGTDVGSPVYKKYKYGAQAAVMGQSGSRYGWDYSEPTLRQQTGGNFSKKSIEFVNYTGNGAPAVQPGGFISNTLDGDPDVTPTTKINFKDTLISGVTATAQPSLNIIAGSDFTQIVNANDGTIDSKIEIIPNNLDSVYDEDMSFTDINEYCVLEIGAAIPAFCMTSIGNQLKYHPGAEDRPTCLSVATSTNFSLYTFYIRLKAKGTGYPPNSKIPVYIRRGAAWVQGYDTDLLPSNPGPTLEIGQVDNITVDGRGSGGPCVCIIHTDVNGITTHITEYVDPASKCRTEELLDGDWNKPSNRDYQTYTFRADVNDGVNYDGAQSPPMTHPNGSGEWYNERPSQYRRLMNLGEVSNSIYGYAKDYIAPIDLVDQTDAGKAKWTASSSDSVLKAHCFGTIARYMNATTWEKDNKSIAYSTFPVLSARDKITAKYIYGVTPWQEVISKKKAQQPILPSSWRDQRITDSRKFSWQSFTAWQAYRDVYRTKGVTYNRSSNLTDLAPVGQLLYGGTGAAAVHDVPAYNKYDGEFLSNRPPAEDGTSSNYYFRPGTNQNLKDDHLLFDRHGFTNEGFAPGIKVPYQTPDMGPDYIVCRVATPNGYVPWYSTSSSAFHYTSRNLRPMTSGLYVNSRDAIQSLNILTPGLQGQVLDVVEDHCWLVKGHRNWVSLGDVTAENGGRKIIVHDAFDRNSPDITIQPGIYLS